jgi:hypothetical protein
MDLNSNVSLEKIKMHAVGIKSIIYIGNNEFVTGCKNGMITFWKWGC